MYEIETKTLPKYALNLAKDGRVLSATFSEYASEGQPLVDALPDGNIVDYLYVNEEYAYDPMPELIEPASEPSQLDRIEAQVTYTAMMTDTLLEVE